jgi:hypothetical protein
MGGLSGFKERKSHVLTAGTGAGANYQMRIHIIYGAGADSGEDMYCDSKCNADFSDLRFTSSDETTLLSYWLESKLDGDNAVFWVKVTEDLDSDRTIYVYYGNDYAASLSSQANTFIDVIGGVVGAWNMEEDHAIDTVVDYSGNGNDGTPTGTTIVPSKFAGKTSRYFDGASKIDCGNDATLNLVDGLTLIVWSKITDFTDHDILLSRGYNDLTGGYCYTVLQNTGLLNAWVKNENYDGVYTILAGVWNFFAYTFSSGANNVKLNVNNDVATQTTTTKVLSGASAFNATIGYDPANMFYKGILCNMILFNSPPSATQQTNLYGAYGDVSLEAGKVLVRKYATTALPTHGDWGTELSLPCYCSRHARRRRLKRGR